VVKDEKLNVDPHAGPTVSNSRFADMGNPRLRYYTPANGTKDSMLPVIAYYRGGGWVIADLDTYDASASALARKANAIVISVDYPLAPEHKFPAQHDVTSLPAAFILSASMSQLKKGFGSPSSTVGAAPSK
jgi:acetyl esterase/lipase